MITGILHAPDPLRPEENGQRASEHHEDQQERGTDRRLNRQPFAQQHAERWKQHRHHAQQGDAGRERHLENKSVHILDVAASDLLLDSADTEEKQSFGNRMEGNDRKSRRIGKRRVDSGAGDHESEVGNRGICQHLFRIALSSGEQCAADE